MQGQICYILRPQLAMNCFLPLWPHRFPHFGYIHLGGGGAGGSSDIRSMSSIRPICKCRCPQLGRRQLGSTLYKSACSLVLQTASTYTGLSAKLGQKPVRAKSTVFVLLFAPKPPSSCEYLEPYQPQIIS